MDTERAASPLPPRLHSLDAYRGFIMLAMASAGFGLEAVMGRMLSAGEPAGWVEPLARQFDHVPWRGGERVQDGVGQRLKLAGMRWGEDGTDALCHLRALYHSEKGRWEAFWNRDYSLNRSAVPPTKVTPTVGGLQRPYLGVSPQ